MVSRVQRVRRDVDRSMMLGIIWAVSRYRDWWRPKGPRPKRQQWVMAMMVESRRTWARTEADVGDRGSEIGWRRLEIRGRNDMVVTITTNHRRSLQLTKDHYKSWRITANHEGSLQIMKDHCKSRRITTNHERSPEITRDHSKSLGIPQNHTFLWSEIICILHFQYLDGTRNEFLLWTVIPMWSCRITWYSSSFRILQDPER
jgi:hypothetical protein